MFVLGHIWESNRVYECVRSLIWDTGLMGVNPRETEKGRKGQNMSYRRSGRDRGRERRSRQYGSVMWVKARGWIESECHVARLWEKSHMTAAADGQNSRRSCIYCFKGFRKKCGSFPRTKWGFYSWWDLREEWRQRRGDTERDWIPPCGSLLIGLITV